MPPPPSPLLLASAAAFPFPSHTPTLPAKGGSSEVGLLSQAAPPAGQGGASVAARLPNHATPSMPNSSQPRPPAPQCTPLLPQQQMQNDRAVTAAEVAQRLRQLGSGIAGAEPGVAAGPALRANPSAAGGVAAAVASNRSLCTALQDSTNAHGRAQGLGKFQQAMGKPAATFSVALAGDAAAQRLQGYSAQQAKARTDGTSSAAGAMARSFGCPTNEPAAAAGGDVTMDDVMDDVEPASELPGMAALQPQERTAVSACCNDSSHIAPIQAAAAGSFSPPSPANALSQPVAPAAQAASADADVGVTATATAPGGSGGEQPLSAAQLVVLNKLLEYFHAAGYKQPASMSGEEVVQAITSFCKVGQRREHMHPSMQEASVRTGPF